MRKMSMMPRLAALAIAALIGVAVGASALAQPATPHQFFGGGLAEGDTVGLGDATATADADGNWGLQTTSDVADAADENSFTLNGKAATAELTPQGDSLTQVSLTVAMMEDDGEMMDEGDGEMMEDDDSMMEDDDSMMEDDDSMLDEEDSMTDFPETGTGGLADNSGISAGLVGLLIALGAAAIAGLGYRRVRNRA